MPIGIFLFALKSDFQKSGENVEKRRNPEKISGFSVGIFFCQDALRRVDKKDAIRNIKSQTIQATGNYYTTERILQHGKDTPPPGHHIRESRELSM